MRAPEHDIQSDAEGEAEHQEEEHTSSPVPVEPVNTRRRVFSFLSFDFYLLTYMFKENVSYRFPSLWTPLVTARSKEMNPNQLMMMSLVSLSVNVSITHL